MKKTTAAFSWPRVPLTSVSDGLMCFLVEDNRCWLVYWVNFSNRNWSRSLEAPHQNIYQYTAKIAGTLPSRHWVWCAWKGARIRIPGYWRRKRNSDLQIRLRVLPSTTQYFSLLLTSREGRFGYDLGKADANLSPSCKPRELRLYNLVLVVRSEGRRIRQPLADHSC